MVALVCAGVFQVPASATGVSGATARYVASRQVVIEYRAASTNHVEDADVWVSSDSGRSWQKSDAARVGRGTLRFTAPADGTYQFYLVLRNEAGSSAEPPEAGSAPTTTVIVDTVPPLLQLHSASAEITPSDSTRVLVKASLVEENLSESGIRIFYRANSGDWIDGGPATFSAGVITWTPPESAPSSFALRVVVTDLAGNRASGEIAGVKLPSPPNIDHSSSSRVIASDDIALASDVAIPAPPPPSQDDSLSPAARAELQNLRQLARRFADQGQNSLAIARLEDALKLSPQDTDVLVDLGQALYRAGRYTDADGRFKTATAAAPDHVGALEGLALVAATEKRYPDAREHLQHLLRLLPDSSSVWLRYGDIEHRLGNTTQALDAWERVLNLPDDGTRDKALRRLDYFRPARKHGR